MDNQCRSTLTATTTWTGRQTSRRYQTSLSNGFFSRGLGTIQILSSNLTGLLLNTMHNRWITGHSPNKNYILTSELWRAKTQFSPQLKLTWRGYTSNQERTYPNWHLKQNFSWLSTMLKTKKIGTNGKKLSSRLAGKQKTHLPAFRVTR